MDRALAVTVAVWLQCAAPCRADTAGADGFGAPRVFVTTRPAASSNGIYLFALYANGVVLHPAPDFRLHEYMIVKLTPSERKALVGDLPLGRIGALHPPGRPGLRDGSVNCITVFENRRQRRTCIYGDVEPEADIPFGSARTHPAPPEMVTIWKRLAHFSSARATPWVPSDVEVHLAPWGPISNCGTPHPQPWPSSWQQPTPRADGGPTVFHLAGTALPELSRMRTTRTAMGCVQPVELDGHYYHLPFRILFPGDGAGDAFSDSRR